MKHGKIILSVLLTAVMCIALCVGMNMSDAHAATGATISPNDFYWKMTPEERATFDFELTDIDRIWLIKDSTQPFTLKIPKKAEVTALSNYFMQALVKNPIVTVDLTFEYEGTTYNVIIPAGQAVDDDTDWYGPLYLVGKYGGTIVE